MRYVYLVLYRALMLAVTIALCRYFALRAGTGLAIVFWALSIGIVCGVIALLMRMQNLGSVTIVNRIAVIVLPWGFKIGRGKLHWIVLNSWIIWALLGVAIIVLIRPRQYHLGLLMQSLLLASWIIDAAVLLRLTTMIAINRNFRSLAPGTLKPIVTIACLLAASLGMGIFGHSAFTTKLALLVSGVPIILVGGVYGFYILFVMTVGRNARWN